MSVCGLENGVLFEKNQLHGDIVEAAARRSHDSKASEERSLLSQQANMKSDVQAEHIHTSKHVEARPAEPTVPPPSVMSLLDMPPPPEPTPRTSPREGQGGPTPALLQGSRLATLFPSQATAQAGVRGSRSLPSTPERPGLISLEGWTRPVEQPLPQQQQQHQRINESMFRPPIVHSSNGFANESAPSLSQTSSANPLSMIPAGSMPLYPPNSARMTPPPTVGDMTARMMTPPPLPRLQTWYISFDLDLFKS